jgi:hypothetical protein
VYSTDEEIMVVSMFGHAMTTKLPGNEKPLLPTEPTEPSPEGLAP